MLRTSICAVFATVLISLAAMNARAELMLSLSSDAPDLNALTPGQTVTFSVELSGLEANQELDSLAATIVYDDSLLGDPLVFPGALVPDPLDDPFDFLVSEWPGEADATFSTFGTASADHIVSDGTFLTFEVTVQAGGSGQVSFDFVDATQFNSADPLSPIQLTPNTSAALDFNAVPEPSTLTLAISALLLGGVATWRRRRSRT